MPSPTTNPAPFDPTDPLDLRARLIATAARSYVRASRGEEISAATWLEELGSETLLRLWTIEEVAEPLFVARVRNILAYAIDAECACSDCRGEGSVDVEYARSSAALEPSYRSEECESCEGSGLALRVTLVEEPSSADVQHGRAA